MVTGVCTDDVVNTMTMGHIFALELQQHTGFIQSLVSNAEQELRIEKRIAALNEVTYFIMRKSKISQHSK